MQPTLAIIDIDIRSGEDEKAREELLQNLETYHEPWVTPLWVNMLRERADLRLVCLLHDPVKLDDFLLDVVRKVPGVRGTAAHLSFDGMVRGDAVMDLALQDAVLNRRAAATVQVKSQPGLDREVYQQLVNLPKHKQVEVVWVVKHFHSTEADLMLLLLGDRTSALTGYVMSWVRTVPGVVDTQLLSVLDWRILGDAEAFLALARRFPEPSIQKPRERSS
jgi:hypothetical protein